MREQQRHVLYTTENTTYEIDGAHKRVRRLNSRFDPTPRQGTEGEWKDYHTLRSLTDGSMLILWRYAQSGVAECTLTSRVVSVQ